jgi:ribose transport system substrate-binding protein
MKKTKFVLLVVENNDYQAEQTISAKEAARECDVDLQVMQTEHDAVMQSQEVLKLLYSPAEIRPDGILFEPVGTALEKAARIAATSGVGWVVLNREADYLKELRRQSTAPLFCVTTNHDEVGRIQGEQIAHLLPHGGAVLYIQGPSDNKAAVRRASAMQKAKPTNVDVRVLKGLWTEESAYNAVSSWLKLNMAKDVTIGLVAGQNDAMALGARRVFQELTAETERDHWLSLPYIGCDGLPNTGQVYVHRGLLRATIAIPANAGQAIRTLVNSLKSKQQPPEYIYTNANSFPPLTSLKPKN